MTMNQEGGSFAVPFWCGDVVHLKAQLEGDFFFLIYFPLLGSLFSTRGGYEQGITTGNVIEEVPLASCF